MAWQITIGLHSCALLAPCGPRVATAPEKRFLKFLRAAATPMNAAHRAMTVASVAESAAMMLRHNVKAWRAWKRMAWRSPVRVGGADGVKRRFHFTLLLALVLVPYPKGLWDGLVPEVPEVPIGTFGSFGTSHLFWPDLIIAPERFAWSNNE